MTLEPSTTAPDLPTRCNMATRVPILIAGAGPVGLALAGDLGWRGQPCLLIEQGDGSIHQPRMDMVGVRTMEFCRRWGIVPWVEACPYPRDYPQDNVYLTSFAGWELGREPMPTMEQARPPEQSPQRRERCPQNMFDPILRRFAQSHAGVALRYRTRIESFTQDATGVRAVVTDQESGQRETIEAEYLVGCDGAGSVVRDALGIGLQGNPVLTYTTNVIFRTDELNALHTRAPGYRAILIGPEGTWATIVAINGRDQWRFSIIGSTTRREWSVDDIHAAIRRAVGKPFRYEILSIVPWTRRELVAETFRDGRVFIAGDAAHMMSPTGGFGMNTGIGDAIDLSWKLAALREGWGGEALLDAYTAERKRVAQRNVTEASGNLARMCSVPATPELWDDTTAGAAARSRIGAYFTEIMKREWFTLGIHLGYRYDDSPIIWADDSPAPPSDVSRYVQTSRPGARAPHVWLEGSFPSGRSTLDLFGRGFVLLDLGEVPAQGGAPSRNTLEGIEPSQQRDRSFGGSSGHTAADTDEIERCARQRGVPLTIHPITHPSARAIYERRFVLVRPDGHTCWRGDVLPEQPDRWLARVVGR